MLNRPEMPSKKLIADREILQHWYFYIQGRLPFPPSPEVVDLAEIK